ncbi:DUF2306 domain-containing protein [Pseudooceanicola sp. MF1-13]|uniref:DUF2306 domain-containing protein n=1 Tax=Pseudooceanicola sp. MF1-13 TaxID=3379095 RepID=UPI003892A6B3
MKVTAMTFDPLMTAMPSIQIHVAAALLSVVLLPLTLFRRRRDRVHKITGYVWVTAMLVTAVSSFWINGIRMVGPFSPIHLLSVLVIFNVIWALVEVRRSNIARHELILKATAFWSLGVAGLFTLLPGRMMGEMVFGDAQVTGFTAAFTLAVLLVVRNGFPKGFRAIEAK